MKKKMIFAMMSLFIIIACDVNPIEDELDVIVADAVRIEDSVVMPRTMVDEWWVDNKCYLIEGPFAMTRTITHPLITSTNSAGNCTLTMNVHYQLYKVYEPVGNTNTYARYYTAIAEIERVKVNFSNNTETYLLWQDLGSRAYCTSSNMHPVLYPQRTINVIFYGKIVGEKGFFNPYEPADYSIEWKTSFNIPTVF